MNYQLFCRAVQLIRSEFSERDFHIFLTRVVNGPPAREVALQFNVTVNTVFIIQSRIIKRVRDEFGALLDEDQINE